MPFGSKNVPTINTDMIQFWRDNYIILFQETRHIIYRVKLWSNIINNNCIIIDNIILFSNYIPTILNYFCVTQISTKYRLSFKLSKCNFSNHEWNKFYTISLLM